MKKILISLAVTVLISTSALATEEIKLAEAIGGASSSTAGSGAAAGGTTAAATGSSFTASNTIAIGALTAAGLGVVAGANSSTSH